MRGPGSTKEGQPSPGILSIRRPAGWSRPPANRQIPPVSSPCNQTEPVLQTNAFAGFSPLPVMKGEGGVNGRGEKKQLLLCEVFLKGQC